MHSQGYTLWLANFIKKFPVSIVIDCGSIPNFKSEHIAKQLGLSVVDATPFSVGIIDENPMTSVGTCHLLFAMQGYFFDVTVSLLAVKGSDVVLGYDGLQKLGFSSLTSKS